MDTYKHKENIIRATQLWECGDITRENLEYIFPELKEGEDEDERIRKWIIDDIRYNMNNEPLNNSEYKKKAEKAIAWLEKQGQVKEYTFKMIPRLLEMIEPTERAKAYCQKLIDALTKEGYITDAKIVEECLKQMNGEKVALATMDEQKINKSEDERVRKAIIEFFELQDDNTTYSLVPKKDILAWLEKQGEQKSVNKLEPKFKVGDWVVRGKTIAQILDIQEQYYVGLDIDGNDFTSSRFLSDDKIHLWTIADAKDGDILVASDGSIFLFKCTIDCACKHYVALTINDDIELNEGLEHYWETSRAVHPATRKQCDLLFQKMHKAGWEWGAEKKELRKIEKQSKPKWSEDDESKVEDIIYFLDAAKIHYASTKALDDCIDWLKSLKQRIGG